MPLIALQHVGCVFHGVLCLQVAIPSNVIASGSRETHTVRFGREGVQLALSHLTKVHTVSQCTR